jgi:hypothetical protein
MTKNISKKLYSPLDYFSGYQILGGCVGIFFILISLFKVTIFSVGIFLHLFIALCLFSFSIFCGVKLLNNPIVGIKYSLLNQGLQMFCFSGFGFSYEYVAGISFNVNLYLESLMTEINGGISFLYFATGSQTDFSRIGINIIAVILIFWLLLKVRSIDRELMNNDKDSRDD